MSETVENGDGELALHPGALSEGEIRAYVDRCPEETRWAFEGWLRGERQLDGDRILLRDRPGLRD